MVRQWNLRKHMKKSRKRVCCSQNKDFAALSSSRVGGRRGVTGLQAILTVEWMPHVSGCTLMML